MARVLIVDDEREIAELLRDFLAADGFEVELAFDGEAGLQKMAGPEFDCILLDVMMPGRSGYELCRLIRERSLVPILFLSAHDQETNKIRGLGLGADDYISKRVSAAEVVSRVKAMVRRYRTYATKSEAASTAKRDFGHFAIDTTARVVTVQGEPVHLTTTEYDLLLCLADHTGQALSREQLFDRVWGDFGDLHTVTVHVANLREKIEPDPVDPTFIKTVRGVGYRFEGGRGR